MAMRRNTGYPLGEPVLSVAGMDSDCLGESFGESLGEPFVLYSTRANLRRSRMKKLQTLWISLATSPSRKALYILLTLAALAVAAGAPGAGSGIGGGGLSLP